MKIYIVLFSVVVIGISEEFLSPGYYDSTPSDDVFLQNPVTLTILHGKSRNSQERKERSFLGCFVRALGGPVTLQNEFVRNTSDMSRQHCILSTFYLQGLSTTWQSPGAKNTGNKKFTFTVEKIGYILQGLKKSHPLKNRLRRLLGIA